MTSNSEKMTLEDKLVQRIKTTELAALIDDEDSINTLVGRAIHEAIIQPVKTTVGIGYHEKTTIEPSPVVKAAQEIAVQAVTELMAAELEKIKSDPKTMEAIRDAIAKQLPVSIRATMAELQQHNMEQTSFTAINKMQELIRTGGLR